MALMQQWGNVGISYQEDGWYGELTQEMTFVQAARGRAALVRLSNLTYNAG